LDALSALARATEELARHFKRKTETKSAGGNRLPPGRGTYVFIGHGGSQVWKELRDFIRDRLGLPYDEFNRVSMAGRATTARLQEMLDNAAFAFLVMTGEDEAGEDKIRARQNVVHEIGLFQARLGFERAIIVLEEVCECFSNADGLTYIGFPKGNIGAAFEKMREVLEREGLIDPARLC
jgi:predicted nucleotide-binding protein